MLLLRLLLPLNGNPRAHSSYLGVAVGPCFGTQITLPVDLNIPKSTRRTSPLNPFLVLILHCLPSRTHQLIRGKPRQTFAFEPSIGAHITLPAEQNIPKYTWQTEPFRGAHITLPVDQNTHKSIRQTFPFEPFLGAHIINIASRAEHTRVYTRNLPF